MLDSASISSISLSGSTGISAIALQSSTAASSAFVSALLDNARNTVELSSDGQLLLTVSLFQDGLDALQGSTSDATPTVLTATAQAFVDAFNTLLSAIDTAQTETGTLSGSTFTGQLVEAANEPALREIGIQLQPAAIPEIAAAGFTLGIDQNALDAAVAADAAGTAAQLAGAIGTFSDLAGSLVTQVAGSAVSLADLALPGTVTGQQADLNVNAALVLPAASAVPADLLPGLPTATVLNGTFLSSLDLAIAGAAAGDIVAAGGSVTQETLTAAFLALNSATTSVAAVETTANIDLAATATGNATPLAVTVAADTGGTEETAAVGAELAANPVTTAVPATTGAVVTTTTDLGTSEASLALQRLLLDPTFHVTSNLINPAYAALIASSHLSDFASPSPVINPNAFAADFPGPVSAVAMAHAVAYYGDAVDEKFGRAMSLGRVMSRA